MPGYRRIGRANLYFRMENSKILSKDFKGAIKDFSDTLKLIPNDAFSYFNRGISKSNLNNQEDAISTYTTCINIKPTHVIIRLITLGVNQKPN